MSVKAGVKFCFNGMHMIPERIVSVIFYRLLLYGFGYCRRYFGFRFSFPQDLKRKALGFLKNPLHPAAAQGHAADPPDDGFVLFEIQEAGRVLIQSKYAYIIRQE